MSEWARSVTGSRYGWSVENLTQTPEPPTAATQLMAGAVYDLDWHVLIEPPDRGPVGLCLGQDEDFDPAAATAYLAREGWLVTGEWRDAPDDEGYFQYVAPVQRADTAPATEAA